MKLGRKLTTRKKWKVAFPVRCSVAGQRYILQTNSAVLSLLTTFTTISAEIEFKDAEGRIWNAEPKAVFHYLRETTR